jgi:hypothetical protein
VPTDLIGITIGRYNAARQDGNLRAALGPFCNDVRNEFKKVGASSVSNVHGKRRKPTVRSKVMSKSQSRGLIVIEALYGARDHRINVARKLNSLVRNNKLRVYVGNQLGGDPCPNTQKDIAVRYSYNGFEDRVVVAETEDLILPRQRDTG